MKHNDGTPCWLDLSTPDLDGARRFYTAVFGWEWAIGGAEFGNYSQALVDGAPVAGLGPLPPSGDARSSWLVYLQVPDAAARAAAIAASGGTVVAPAMDVADFGRMAVVADPAGAVFGLWQPGTHTGFQHMGPHGSPCWFEVNVPSGDAAVSFYGHHFGGTPAPMDNTPTPYFTMQTGERPRYGILQMNAEWAGVPPHWVAYFAVSDTDTAAAAVTTAGGKVCHGPFDTPFGRLAICEDPSGAVFTVIKPVG